MGRQDTIVFGSGVATSSATGATNDGALAGAPAVTARRLPPVSPPPRPERAGQGGRLEHGAPGTTPASEPLDADWFAPTSPMLRPIGHELAERRGWTPPRAGKGLGFAVASVVAIAVASAGTFFFVGPAAETTRPAEPEPTSTTTISQAELTPDEGAPPMGATPLGGATPPAVAAAPLTGAAPATTEGADTAVAPAAATTARAERAITPADLPAAPATARRAVAPRANAERPKEVAETSLPDLDRAAAAAGASPRDDAPADKAPSQAAPEPPAAAPEPPALEYQDAPRTAPPPSEVLPELQIKR
ncbi:MAG: hypothetical protein KF850_08415 [Labilithrix sp.]|nr:hypothetical protein [Labilithrix sp.]